MKKFKKTILLYLAISLLIVLGSFSVLFFSFKKQVNLENEVLKTERNVMQIDSLINNLLELESDKRAYQITSDIDYLKKYYRIKTLCSESFKSLKEHSTNEIDLAKVKKTEMLMNLRLANMDSGLLLLKTASPGAAMALMQKTDKKLIREQLTKELELLKKSFLKQFQDSTSGIKQYSVINKAGLLVLLFVFIILMLLATFSFKRAQQRMIKNHFKFKEAQRIAKIGSWEWDFATNKLKWSSEQFKIFGEQRGEFELTFENYLSHFSNENQLKIKNAIARIFAGESEFIFEHEIIRKDGSQALVYEQGKVLYDKYGKQIGLFGTTQDITERKTMDEKIKAERLLLRTVIDNLPDTIYVKNTSGQKIIANKADLDIIGVASEADVIGKTDLELFSNAQAEQAYNDDLQIIQTGQSLINKEEIFTDRTGLQRYLLTSKVPFYDIDGNVSGLVGIGRDFTGRKRAEEELAAAQKKFKDIFDNSVEGIYRSTKDGRFIMANASMARIFGYATPEELITSITDIRIQIYVNPIDRTNMADLILRCGKVENYELQVLTKKGEPIWVKANIGSGLNDKGEFEYFEGTLEDISERKRSEQQLLNLSNRFQLAIKATNIGIWDWDVVNENTVWDDEMFKMYNVDKDECKNITEAWESALHPDDLKRVREELHLALKGEKEFDTEFKVLWKDNSVHYIRGHALVQFDEFGKALKMIGTNEDITQRKLDEGEILLLNRNLEQFANITAHDLQEPIRMVSGFLGLLDKKYSNLLDEQGQSYIHRAKDGADRMTILIRDLLEYSRSGNKAAKKEFVNLSSVVDLVQKDMSIVMDDTAADLFVQNNLPIVEGTQSALYRLFLNLVSNGIKFRKKGISPKVDIQLQEEPDCWKFTVQDNGIGVAEKDQAKLFKAFQRLHRKEEYPGTGLGLVTCKKIVETHGGKIWMTSEYGKGTAFHFTLPKMRA